MCNYCAHVLLRSFLIPAHTLSTVSMVTRQQVKTENVRFGCPHPCTGLVSGLRMNPSGFLTRLPPKDLGGISGCVGLYELLAGGDYVWYGWLMWG